MTQREARRLALLVIADEIGRSLDTSDEWTRHPETDEEFNREDAVKVLAQGRRFVESLEARIAKATI